MSRLSLPSIKRFRDFRAYGFETMRYLDLWQNNGAAFWGHTPRGLSQVLKNSVSPGLYAPFPHSHFSRIKNRVYKLYPGWEPWVFPSWSAIREWLASIGFPLTVTNDEIFGRYQWFGSSSQGIQAATLRPGITDSLTISLTQDLMQEYSLLIPLLPLPSDLMGSIVLVRSDVAQQVFRSLVAAGPQISGIQVEALIWVLDSLLKIPSGWRPWVSGQGFPLPYDLPTSFPGFQRVGRYLLPLLDKTTYTQYYRIAKQEGILLNPQIYQGQPGISILPGYGSIGEWKKILSVLSDIGVMDE